MAKTDQPMPLRCAAGNVGLDCYLQFPTPRTGIRSSPTKATFSVSDQTAKSCRWFERKLEEGISAAKRLSGLACRQDSTDPTARQLDDQRTNKLTRIA